MARGRSAEFLRALRKKHHLGEFKLSRGKAKIRRRKDSRKPLKARRRRKKGSTQLGIR